MSSWPRRLALLGIAIALGSGAPVPPETVDYGLGTTPTQQQIDGWAIAARPDGQGLPPGHGSVKDGDDLYATMCSTCHGTFGEGEGRYPRLVGEGTLTGERPEPTIQSYWPYATTVFDYVNRAMPFPTPHMLTPDQVYAITAYVLNISGIVGDDFVADRDSLPKVQMPNRNGFIWHDPRPDTHDTACMTDCRNPADIKITSTAEGKNLTPRETGPLDTSLPQ
ncbi:MAG TPA: cytochrome c [Acidisphaera sp.]|nr:cytochrome c [Acidisphaera sp.]